MNTGRKTRRLVLVALFSAIVVLLQFLGSFIRFGPFSVSLVLVPIVVGAALCGIWAAVWLGAVFGLIVLLSGDAAAFLAINPAATVAVVFIKGIAAGLVAGIVYRALYPKNKYAAVITAAAAAPIANTGLFLIGCLLFFMPTIREWAGSLGFADAGTYMIYGLVGGNFIFEFLVNIVLSGVILRIINIGKKMEEV
ncbi:MAG: ECF transporter S component [Lachnospiraceae bacterium]|jgi:uncharacterized membrane protein|nr:ECF transporter S component [Lachnospiraceae bacterium]